MTKFHKIVICFSLKPNKEKDYVFMRQIMNDRLQSFIEEFGSIEDCNIIIS